MNKTGSSRPGFAHGEPKHGRIVLGLCLLALVLTLGACSFNSAKITSNEPIKMQVIAPLTGPASEYGTATKDGLELAMEKINKDGGINGRSVQLSYQDDKCDPKEGVAALQKSNSTDGVNVVIGTVCSSVVLAMGPIALEKNLLIISSGASNPRISEYSNVFRTWPSDALQGKFIAGFVADNLKKTNAAIIYINNDYGAGLKDAFTKEFTKNGGAVAIAEAIPEGATDVKTQLMKVKSANPEVIFLATFAKEMGTILKQAKELGISAQFVGGEGSKDPSVIEIGGQGAEGLIGTIPAIASGDRRDEFIKSFKEKYNKEPGITADSAYDIPFLLKETMAKCVNVSDVNCLKKNLLSLENFEGAIGSISFDENGDLVGKSYDLLQIKNGKFISYEK